MMGYSHRISREDFARLGQLTVSPPVPGRPNPEPDQPTPSPADEGEMPDEDGDDAVLRGG